MTESIEGDGEETALESTAKSFVAHLDSAYLIVTLFHFGRGFVQY
jgi:hypothetical protein